MCAALSMCGGRGTIRDDTCWRSRYRYSLYTMLGTLKFTLLELELEVASIQMNEDDSRRGKKQFCLFESPVVPQVKIEFFLEVVDSCTFQ